MKVEIKNRFTGSIIISGDYESLKNCLEHNRGANLRGANLGDAYLGGANLRGAYLGDADLGGAKGYVNSHDIFQEAVRRQPVSTFNDTEWAAIAQIVIHCLCWDSIKKRFTDEMPHIFETLANEGFTEWLEYWNSEVK